MQTSGEKKKELRDANSEFRVRKKIRIAICKFRIQMGKKVRTAKCKLRIQREKKSELKVITHSELRGGKSQNGEM